ncbi:sporulation-specific diadenylate cyclase CdaS [Paenibacillus gansuensis]|uniref:Diadenylate cyclase n=1 Tax=Paenibacillus gansuensis TaxID=306542 RepID=A0ABW5P801_9BACL
MEHDNCDFSPLRIYLKEQLEAIKEQLDTIIAILDNDSDKCLLNQFDGLSRKFTETETLASTYYLNCFLSPFTTKYNEISRSIQQLSTKRQGALIVMERSDELSSWITPGIPLAAAITSSLLESIFVPASPLHDGAVLIRDDTIHSAANILPLTEQKYDSYKLGTRHRAAIGLSERTDALVLVVSEESGKPSFCVGGTLYPLSIS